MPTKVEKDAITGTDTTGHEWDGIKELDTPLPKWWLYVFYACVAWALVYYVFYPSWPYGKGYLKGILGYSSRVEVAEKLAEARQSRKKFFDAIEKTPLEEIEKNPELLNFALVGGRAVFADNCAPCHGAGGAGAKGYPNLADDDWLWGGDLEAIYTTIKHGVRAPDDEETRDTEMPRFGADELLTPEEINDVAEYVLSLSGNETDAQAAARGKPIFEENCAACHGEDGEGNPDLGAPRLNDAIWLYGGDKKTVVETITYARRGVMPAWGKRLDDSTIKMLAVYEHALGGGQ